MATIRELITKLGFEIDDDKLDRFENRVEKVKTGLIAMTAVGVAAVAGLVAITKTAANTGDTLDAQASLFGIDVQKLQIWTRAAALADIEAGEFTSSLQFLNRNLGDAARDAKGPAAKVFKELGIHLKNSAGEAKNSGDVLEELQAKFAKIDDPAKRASLAMDIFGRGGQRMGRFLAEAADDVKQATEIVTAFGFYTEESAALADKANDRWDDTVTLITGIKNAIGIGLLPVMKDLLTRFNQFLLRNKDIINTKIDRFVTMTTKAIHGLVEVAKAVAKPLIFIVEALGGIENAAKLAVIALASIAGATVVGAVMAFISMMAAMGVAIGAVLLEVIGIPLLIALAIAALIIIFDELYGWITGADSLLGDWLGSWTDFSAKMQDEFKFMVEMLKTLWLGFKTTFIGLFDFLTGAWGAITAIWSGDTKKFIDSSKKAFLGLINFLLTGPLEMLGSMVAIALDGIFEGLKGAVKIIGELITAAIPPGILKLISYVGGKVAEGGAAIAGSLTGSSQAPGMMTPGGFVPNFAGMGRPPQGTSTTNHIEVNANVTAPAGSSEQQQVFLKAAMEQIADEVFGRQVGHVMQNNPKRE